ncbi:hypothetical protein CVT25_000495 [Psilocybe cyanescens]|uniref:Uncharacterized protein n=1 Tax=Psilocybe cyanescens TaxID=93625 RepID=A0A409XWB3_PSICY|nr:hypothetical protein CVT25_000495 [Psilocybe cyanescens]
MNSPAQSLWYRRSVNTAYKIYYTDYRFRNFVRDAGKGAFVDAEFHPTRWYRFNTGEAFWAYLWAIEMVPLLLDKSGYSEELIAYARKTRIRRDNDYLNFVEFNDVEKYRKSAQAALKAYLRRVEDGRT